VITVENKLKKATNTLILNHPFWAALRFRLKTVIGTGDNFPTQTAATDGITMWFNTEFCEPLEDKEFLGLVVHELGHVVFLHSLRRGVRDPQVWNIAADYVINLAITKDGFTLPEGGLLNHKYADMHTEEVYKKIYNKQKHRGNPDKPCNGGEGGQGQQGQGKVCQCPWGEVLDAQDENGKPMSKDDKKKLEQETAVNIRQAVETAKKQGNMPGHIKDAFDELLKPVVDWRDILSRFLSDCFPSDFSWMNASRRGLAMGQRMPGNGEEESYEQIAMAIDSSGSISTNEIQQMMSEACHCLSEYEAKGIEIDLPVAYCDTAVHHTEVLTPGDKPYQDAKGGGGGTDFAPIMSWVTSLPERPAALLYMTDGYCDSFGSDPGIPVLWILSGPGGNNSSFSPPFGEVMEMVDKDER